jgi:hypothetical protein
MHILDMNQVLLVSRGLAESLIPFLNQLQNPVLRWRVHCQGSFGELSNQLVQEFLGCNLEVEGVSAVLHTVVQQLFMLFYDTQPRRGKKRSETGIPAAIENVSSIG